MERQGSVKEGALQQTNVDCVTLHLCFCFQMSSLHNWTELDLLKPCLIVCVATPHPLIHLLGFVWQCLSSLCLLLFLIV